MNPISKLIWQWQSKRKLTSDKKGMQYTAIRKLGEIGKPDNVELLLPYLADGSQLIRNATALAIRDIVLQVEDQALLYEIRNRVTSRLDKAEVLTEKLSLIQVMSVFPLNLREQVLAPMVKDTQADLQYAVISSIEDTKDLDILDDVLQASDTQDLVLRRITLQTWYTGIAKLKLEDVLDYITPRLHYLVRAAYELQTDGEFLRQALAYAPKSDLPHPKAYPDFIIRYMTELLGTWEYDPDAYRSLHAIMVPSYFTFDSSDSEQRPFLIL